MSRNISFDRAADWYDTTRALPPEVQQAITSALLGELHGIGDGRLLEIGAGTGRISRPLAAAGIRITGIDVSPRMLARFREQLAPGAVDPDLLLGDATHIPFADGTFPAALFVHVLHLLYDWQRGLDELRRVLAPGGVLLHQDEEDDFESHPEHMEGHNAWRGILARRGFVERKRAEREDINEYLAARGGSLRTIELHKGGHVRSEMFDTQSLRARIHSNQWEVPDDVYWPAVDEYEAWAKERFGDLGREVWVSNIYLLDVWTFPEQAGEPTNRR